MYMYMYVYMYVYVYVYLYIWNKRKPYMVNIIFPRNAMKVNYRLCKKTVLVFGACYLFTELS